MKIDELLNKYFEGETSCEEERELRRFFTEEKVPEHLEIYRPLFAYLKQENHSLQTDRPTTAPVSLKNGHGRRIFYLLSGVAAGILLVVSMAQLSSIFTTSRNFVIIDGQRYTDERLAESKALEALQQVGFTENELNNLLFQY